MKYVWINIASGEFSNSFGEEDYELYLKGTSTKDIYKENPQWKLIRYECLTDDKFEFYSKMRLP